MCLVFNDLPTPDCTVTALENIVSFSFHNTMPEKNETKVIFFAIANMVRVAFISQGYTSLLQIAC